MLNGNSLERSLRDLINSRYPKTQMDVFYEGQVILQVFNQSDVRNWSFELPLNKEGGVIVNLFFNNGKRNNVNNYSRFKTTSFYKDFIHIAMNKGKVNSYYLPISRNLQTEEIANRLVEIILEVYEIQKDEPLEILVRSFDNT